MSKRDRKDTPPPAPGPFNPALAKLRAQLPEGWTPPPPPPSTAAAPPAPARAVVRLERKGRGGKEVTVVEKLELAPKLLVAWADDLKRSLGCGGAVEDGAIVLQGDQRERARAWLEKRNVRKVIAG